MEDQEVQKIAEALRMVFGENVQNGRFIDTTKIPFICKDIEGIHTTLRNMSDNLITKDQFWPVKTLVYGATSIFLTGMLTAIVYLVINK